MKLQAGKKIGLALGGGGARGLADLGVLKVLQEHRIPISYIAGVSVGALIGALYASGMPLKQLVELASRTRWRHLGRLGFPLMGLSSNERMEGYLARYISQDSFEALQIPLRVIATNLLTGLPVVFDRGPLFRAVRASCAVPGIYAPVDMNDMLLADGCLVSGAPATHVRRMGADIVIAVSIRTELTPKTKITNVYQVLMQSFGILSQMAREFQPLNAEVVVTPQLKDVPWDDLERYQEIEAAGEKAMRAQLPALLDLIRKPGLMDRLAGWLQPKPRVPTLPAKKSA